MEFNRWFFLSVPKCPTLDQRAVTLLVLLAATAGTGIVAADLRHFANQRGGSGTGSKTARRHAGRNGGFRLLLSRFDFRGGRRRRCLMLHLHAPFEQFSLTPTLFLDGLHLGFGLDAHARQRRYHVVLVARQHRSEEHTSELQSLMRISYAVFCLK